MKKLLLFLLLVMSAWAMQAQQSKQVYITLDVSGSMYGDKYVLANYTTQMIVSLCNEADDIHMIIYGQEKNLSKESNPLAVIQKPLNKLDFGKPSSRTSQFDDIVGFNQVYKPSKDKEDWLFIIGDGEWFLHTGSHRYDDDLVKFQDIVKSGNLNVCYLQTGTSLSEQNEFTTYADGLGLVDIRKSSTDPKTIQAGCDYFAKKILGFSDTTFDIQKDGSKAIKIQAELPIKEFLLVYQDEVNPDQLPNMLTARVNGNLLNIQHKGTPTTRPVRDSSNNKKLSGHVWRIQANGVIPANAEIEIAFDKDVNTSKFNIYPVVDEIDFGTYGLTPVGVNLKQLNDNTFSICRDERTALVYVELSESSRNSIPEQLLKKTKVVVKANNKDYNAKFNDGRFEAEIELLQDTTQYYAAVDCPGYFSRVTPIKTIVKGDCEPVTPPTPPEPPIKELKITDLGTMSFQQLKDNPLKVTIVDAETLETLNPNNFDLTLEIDDGYLYDDPKLSIQGNTIVIDVHPKGDWCECLFPTELDIKVTSIPKEGAFSTSDPQYVKTVHTAHLKVMKENPWFSRCFWVIMSIAGLLLFIIYLWLLMKKKRFKKNAMMTPKYYSYFGDLIDDQGGKKLRKEGFGPWFMRWLVPVDERITLSFDSPSVTGLTLIASESNDVVNILKSSCDFETMDVADYDPETDTSKSKTIMLGDMGIISVTASNGTQEGELTFSSGSEKDGAGYRIFIGLLMALSFIAILILAGLMINSFL